jgi:hypothetical protein
MGNWVSRKVHNPVFAVGAVRSGLKTPHFMGNPYLVVLIPVSKSNCYKCIEGRIRPNVFCLVS